MGSAKIRSAIGIASVAALCAALAGSAGASSFYRVCPSAYGPSVLAHRTSCHQAHKVMQKVYVKGQEAGGTNTLHARGWTCHLHFPAYRPITCHRGSRIIKGPLPG